MELALKLPSGQTINSPQGFVFGGADAKLGDILTSAFDLVLFIAGALMFFWILWGVFHYIFAGGSKEGLAKAQSRITWAIVGFLMLLVVFALKQYLETIFPVQVSLPGGIPNVTTPK